MIQKNSSQAKDKKDQNIFIFNTKTDMSTTFRIEVEGMPNNSELNRKYTCFNEQGERKTNPYSDNFFPNIQIFNVPRETNFFALFVMDYDVKVEDNPGKTKPFCHLAMYNIFPSQIINLSSGEKALNSAMTFDFFPACPPRGDTPHKYFFRLLALKNRLEVSKEISWQDIWSTIRDKQKNNLIDEARVGFYFQAPSFK